MALLIGLVLLCLLGLIHDLGQQGIRTVVDAALPTRIRAPLPAFALLAALLVCEVGLFALAYRAVEIALWPGALSSLTSWQDYVYLSFIAFTTLGFTELDVEGGLRILVGTQALGGFIVLTWSATFLYETDQKERHRET